jgi:hypothetical protein
VTTTKIRHWYVAPVLLFLLFGRWFVLLTLMINIFHADMQRSSPWDESLERSGVVRAVDQPAAGTAIHGVRWFRIVLQQRSATTTANGASRSPALGRRAAVRHPVIFGSSRSGRLDRQGSSSLIVLRHSHTGELYISGKKGTGAPIWLRNRQRCPTAKIKALQLPK